MVNAVGNDTAISRRGFALLRFPLQRAIVPSCQRAIAPSRHRAPPFVEQVPMIRTAPCLPFGEVLEQF